MALVKEMLFEEPPPKKDRVDQSRSLEIITALREQPGKWARVEEIPKSGEGCIKAYVKRHGWTDEFQFTTRKDDVKGVYLIYARFIPENERPKTPVKK